MITTNKNQEHLVWREIKKQNGLNKPGKTENNGINSLIYRKSYPGLSRERTFLGSRLELAQNAALKIKECLEEKDIAPLSLYLRIDGAISFSLKIAVSQEVWGSEQIVHGHRVLQQLEKRYNNRRFDLICSFLPVFHRADLSEGKKGYQLEYVCDLKNNNG